MFIVNKKKFFLGILQIINQNKRTHHEKKIEIDGWRKRAKIRKLRNNNQFNQGDLIAWKHFRLAFRLTQREREIQCAI